MNRALRMEPIGRRKEPQFATFPETEHPELFLPRLPDGKPNDATFPETPQLSRSHDLAKPSNNHSGRLGILKCQNCRKQKRKCVFADPREPCESCIRTGKECGDKLRPHSPPTVVSASTSNLPHLLESVPPEEQVGYVQGLLEESRHWLKMQHDLPLNKKTMADPPGSQEDKREDAIFPLSAEYQLPSNYPEFDPPHLASNTWFPFATLDVNEVHHSQESLVETAEGQIDIGDYPVLKSQTESNQKSTGLDENEVHHSESLIETAEGQIDIGDYPVLYSQTASNSAAGATFGFEFPERVSAIITNKEMELRVYLNEVFQDADCLFEGGYDILPPGCSLVFKEQDTLTQNNREMLWVLYNSQLPVDASSLGLLKNQSSLIKSIGDNIFSLVGLVDLRANSVLVYDAAMKDSDYDFDTLLENRLTVFGTNGGASVSPPQPGSSTSAPTGYQSNRNPAPPNSSGDGNQGNGGSVGGDNSNTPPGGPTRDRGSHPPDRSNSKRRKNSRKRRRRNAETPSDPPDSSESEDDLENGPFVCEAKFIGTDNKPQVVYLNMLVNSKRWGHAPRDGRTGCCVTAESFEGGIIGDSRCTFLNIHEVQLDIGPSVEGLAAENPEPEQEEERESGFSTSDQWPKISDWISHWSRTRESGVNVGIALPKSISLNGSHKRGKSYTFQAQTVGLDVKTITIDRWKSNHFLWRYPIAYPSASTGEPFVQGPLDHSAKFSDHSGRITYFRKMPPSSVDLDFTITFRLPGDKPAIQYRGKDYPCRSFRLKLRVKILPNNGAEFLYPRDDSNGIYLNLGTFKCTHNSDGRAVLQVLHENYKVPILDPHLKDRLIDQSHGGTWKMRQSGKGTYDVTESGVHENITSAEGNIDATLGDWSEPKKLKRRLNV